MQTVIMFLSRQNESVKPSQITRDCGGPGAGAMPQPQKPSSFQMSKFQPSIHIKMVTTMPFVMMDINMSITCHILLIIFILLYVLVCK